MRNLLAFAAAAVLAFAGVGWYLGWYQLKTETTTSGHEKVNIDINGTKIVNDVERGKKMVDDMKKNAEKQQQLEQQQSQQQQDSIGVNVNVTGHSD